MMEKVVKEFGLLIVTTLLQLARWIETHSVDSSQTLKCHRPSTVASSAFPA
jgi:hypothetical protein